MSYDLYFISIHTRRLSNVRGFLDSSCSVSISEIFFLCVVFLYLSLMKFFSCPAMYVDINVLNRLQARSSNKLPDSLSPKVVNSLPLTWSLSLTSWVEVTSTKD